MPLAPASRQASTCPAADITAPAARRKRAHQPVRLRGREPGPRPERTDPIRRPLTAGPASAKRAKRRETGAGSNATLGWSLRLKAFAQSEGSDVVDAAVLLMPLVKFISPTDPH